MEKRSPVTFQRGKSFAKLGSAVETNDADIFACKERRRESPGSEMLTLGLCDLERVSIWFPSTPSRREVEGTKKTRMDRARAETFLSLLNLDLLFLYLQQHPTGVVVCPIEPAA